MVASEGFIFLLGIYVLLCNQESGGLGVLPYLLISLCVVPVHFFLFYGK